MEPVAGPVGDDSDLANPALAEALARLSPQQRDALGMALARALVAALDRMAAQPLRAAARDEDKGSGDQPDQGADLPA